ncbi:MAG: HRDC domain-containing protein, partial [Oscillospiraceae bacterium]|nr:HRDC domain-containing protein [Oscillospiraceae bacterium]
ESDPLIKERDRKRLREMTFYCRTGDCLRGCILKYFGEKPPYRCDNCSSCLDSIAPADITVTARKILSCVKRMGERFGAKMVIEVLRGVKSERISRLGLDNLSTYGICDESENRLRDIVGHLVQRDFLRIGGGEYPVLLLGEDAVRVLRGELTVEMRLPREVERAARKMRREPTQNTPGRPMDSGLFERLAALRTEIAKRQGVPAYVVFPDSALADMCLKLPSDNEEFLQVAGVGQVKLERYGEEFLRVISKYELPQADASPAAADAAAEPDMADEIIVSDEAVTVSAIADRVNVALIQRGLKKTTGAKINALLIGEGYLRADCGFKVATRKGEEAGIITAKREIRGETCRLCLFGESAQRLVIEKAIAEFL